MLEYLEDRVQFRTPPTFRICSFSELNENPYQLSNIFTSQKVVKDVTIDSNKGAVDLSSNRTGKNGKQLFREKRKRELENEVTWNYWIYS